MLLLLSFCTRCRLPVLLCLAFANDTQSPAWASCVVCTHRMKHRQPAGGTCMLILLSTCHRSRLPVRFSTHDGTECLPGHQVLSAAHFKAQAACAGCKCRLCSASATVVGCLYFVVPAQATQNAQARQGILCRLHTHEEVQAACRGCLHAARAQHLQPLQAACTSCMCVCKEQKGRTPCVVCICKVRNRQPAEDACMLSFCSCCSLPVLFTRVQTIQTACMGILCRLCMHDEQAACMRATCRGCPHAARAQHLQPLHAGMCMCKEKKGRTARVVCTHKMRNRQPAEVARMLRCRCSLLVLLYTGADDPERLNGHSVSSAHARRSTISLQRLPACCLW